MQKIRVSQRLRKVEENLTIKKRFVENAKNVIKIERPDLLMMM